MGFLCSLIATALFRAWRILRGRDYCETCDGTLGIHGEETKVLGVWMCDACRQEKPSA